MEVFKERIKPLTTFHRFRDLPAELRLQIWRESCFPRVLTLVYRNTTDSFDKCPPPVLFSTSKESRDEASRIYTLFFATRTQDAHIYFNPFRDTIYLPRRGNMGYDDRLRDFTSLVQDDTGLLKEVTHIAVDHVSPDIKRPWESYNKARFTRSFRKLEEVTLVLPNESVPLDKQVEFQEPKRDPEKSLIWYNFRLSFVMEETLLQDVCKQAGRGYEIFTLPTIRIKAKVAKEDAKDVGMALKV